MFPPEISAYLKRIDYRKAEEIMMKKTGKKLLLTAFLAAMLPTTVFAGSGDILPDSGTELISQETADALSDWDLRAARYEITARHGKEVYSQDMKDYFENTGWYQPSDSYDISSLSDTEKTNIQTLYNEELERKQQTAREQFEENQRISASSDVQVMSSSFVYMDSPYAYEDLVGTWVYDVDPTYPHVLEIREEGGLFYYEYYSIAPGNDSGIGFANTYTKWGRFHGLAELNTETGYLTCYNDDTKDSGIFESYVYDVMSDTFVEATNDQYRKSFSKNDEFEYVL